MPYLLNLREKLTLDSYFHFLTIAPKQKKVPLFYWLHFSSKTKTVTCIFVQIYKQAMSPFKPSNLDDTVHNNNQKSEPDFKKIMWIP